MSTVCLSTSRIFYLKHSSLGGFSQPSPKSRKNTETCSCLPPSPVFLRPSPQPVPKAVKSQTVHALGASLVKTVSFGTDKDQSKKMKMKINEDVYGTLAPKKEKSIRAYAAIAAAWRGQSLSTGWELNLTVTGLMGRSRSPVPSACLLTCFCTGTFPP